LKHFNNGEFLLILLLTSVTAFLLARTFRTGIDRLRGKRWARTTALIQQSGIGFINAPGIHGRVGFFGYTYEARGAKYVGFFAIMSEQVDLDRLQKKLSGQNIQIRFNPSHRETSFLENLRDPLFEGYIATQDANWISQAPNPGLRAPIS
jgi:hypothetical protein